MPRVKIDYVVSFSSESPDAPASNLLANEAGQGRWLCAKGEPSCSVLLQLPKAVQISSVTIGAHLAALVEVLVGRSETPNDQYKVLVASSVFLSPAESRRAAEGEAGAERVRSFGADQLAADTRAARWDRVRVQCSQPYNKHCKYGLSFIHIFSPEAESESSAPAPRPVPTKAALKMPVSLSPADSDDDEFKPGALFAQHQAKAQSTAAANTDAQIRQATSQALKHQSDSSAKIVRTPISKPKGDSTSTEQARSDRDRDSLLYAGEDDPHDKIDRVVAAHKDQVAKTAEKAKDEEKRRKDKEKERDKDRQSSKERHDADSSKHRKDNTKDDTTYKDKHKARNTDDSHSRDSGNYKKDTRDSHKRNTHDSRRRDSHDSHRRDNHDSHRGDSRDYQRKNKHDSHRRDSHDSHRRDKHDSHKRDTDDSHRKDRDDSKRSDKEDRHRTQQASKRDRSSSSKQGKDDDTSSKKQKVSKDDSGECLYAGPISEEPHTLLSDVDFVLSGYENPRRARVRDAALVMGARFHRDWGPRCTHLICAFPNTPKLKSVRSAPGGQNAVVVTAEWVERCAARQRRLPWQWFATEDARRVTRARSASGEDPPGTSRSTEAKEDSPKRAQEDSPNRTAALDSDCDTEDEIERVMQINAKKRLLSAAADSEEPSPSSKKQKNKADETHNSSHESDVAFVRDEQVKGNVTVSDSDGDGTDKLEDTIEDPPSLSSIAGLPPLFEGCTFALHGAGAGSCAPALDGALLRRYVTAYGGDIVDPQEDEELEVDYVLCLSEDTSGVTARGRRVRGDWVWACHQKGGRVSPREFAVV